MLRCCFLIMMPLWLALVGCVNDCKNTSVKEGYRVTRNIIYTPAEWPAPVLGDLYRPQTCRKSPAVLLIHGGGWTGKDGRWQMEPIASQLVRRGYVVFNVTYRLAPRWHYPAPIKDLREAVKWMRRHAEENGIDPERIAAFGYSAGGYLAAFTGLLEGSESSGICAIVAGGAPSDLTFYPGGDLVPQFLGGIQRQVPQRFREASPVNYVTQNSPPMFLYHGTADQLVKPEHPLAMIRKLEKNSVVHESYWIEGRDHIGTFLFPAAAVNRAVDFLDREMR